MTERRFLLALPYLSTISGISIVVGGLNIRIEQLFVTIASIYLIGCFVFANKRIRFDKAALFLVLGWGISFYASVFQAPDPSYSILQTVNTVTISVAYFIVGTFIKDRKILEQLIYHSFLATQFLSFCGTVLFIISYITKIELFGVNLLKNEFFGIAFGTYFTMREPNYYGSFMLIYFLIAFTLLQNNPLSDDRINKKFLRRTLVLSGLGILLSFTRAVWLALMVCMIFYYARFWKKNLVKFGKILFSIVVISIGLYMAAILFKLDFLTYKITHLFDTEGGSGEGRLLIYYNAYDNWVDSKNFYFGNGTYSYASFFTTGADYSSDFSAWIGSLPLTFLHDTGVIGLTNFMIFFFVLVSYTYKKRGPVFIAHNGMAMGLRLSLTGVFIAFCFSQGTTFSYPWILFGMVSGYRKIILQKQ